MSTTTRNRQQTARQRAETANNPPCRNCETPTYYRDGPYCYSCRSLPVRHCPACQATSQTLGGVCLSCSVALPRAPIFGLDREPDPKKRWVTRDPAVLDELRFVRWTAGAKDDPGIRMAVCDGCAKPFVLPKWNGKADLHEYRIPLAEGQGRWTAGGKAHARCIGSDGFLIVKEPEPVIELKARGRHLCKAEPSCGRRLKTARRAAIHGIDEGGHKPAVVLAA